MAAWLVVSTAGWFALTHTTRQNLKTVNDSLSRVVASTTVDTAARHLQPMQFESTEAGFHLALNSGVSVRHGNTLSMLIAVYGQDGRSAGSDEEVRTSLLRGVVASPGLNPNLAGYSRAILDVRRVSAAPSGLELRKGTLLYAVDLPYDADQSSASLDLYFPQEPSPSGVNIGSLVAYEPVGPVKEEQ